MSAGDRRGFEARARAFFGSALLAGAVGLGASSAAFAQSRFALPDGCGTEAEFSRGLERLLGADASRAAPKSVSIDGGTAGEEYRLVIVLRDGARALRHADCRTLFRSAIVVAAASYQEERRRHRPAGAAPPSRTPRPLPARDERPVPITFALGAGAGAAAGPLPNIAPLFEFSARGERAPFGLSLALRYLSGTEERKPSGHGVFVSGIGARLLLSVEPWHALRAGAGAGVYRLSGEGRGTPERLSDVTYGFEPALELAAMPLRTESLELELALGAHWAAVRPRFLIGGYGEVFRVPTLGGEGLFRVTWRIP